MAKGNKNPLYKQPGKYLDCNGRTLPSKRVRVPEYLYDEIEAIALRLHQEHLQAHTAPVVEIEEEEEPQVA